MVDQSFFFNGKSVVITGAVEGIGNACARIFARLNCHVILMDIAHHQFESLTATLLELGAKSVHCYRLDVSCYDDVVAVADKIHQEFPAIDVLVNNAGIGVSGEFKDCQIDDWRYVFDVNVMGVVHCCRAFINRMVQAKSGHIVNIASVSGYIGDKNISIYAASKHAVIGFSESLAKEMVPHMVGVSVVCPLDVASKVHHHLSEENINASHKVLSQPEDVAYAVVDAIKQKIEVLPVGVKAKWLYAKSQLKPHLARFTQWVKF